MPPLRPTRKKCIYCGTETDINSERCSSCDSVEFKVIDPNAPSPEQEKAREITKEREVTKEREERKHNLIIIAMCFGLIITGLIISMIMIFHSSEKSSSKIDDNKFGIREVVHTQHFNMTVTKYEFLGISDGEYYCPETKKNYSAGLLRHMLLVTVSFKAIEGPVTFKPSQDFVIESGSSSDDNIYCLNRFEFTLNEGETKEVTLVYLAHKSYKNDFTYYGIASEDKVIAYKVRLYDK